MAKRVIGQKQAAEVISDAIRRNRSGLSDTGRPLGCFMFLGPTGVGKTEISKTLADFLFNEEKALTRIDMSEYMEKHAVSRLIGAPPGYVGYEQGGQLTEAVRRRPFSVILFDEIEKAHPDVFNLLLQVLDDGRLTDGQGRSIDFTHSIIIMTSNLGSSWILDENLSEEEIEEKIHSVLKTSFKPEFLNRLDEVVTFHRLDRESILKITSLETDKIREKLSEMKLSFHISPKVLEALADEGWDPLMGARPVKRVIQQRITNPLSRLLLSGKYPEGSTVTLEMNEDDIVFC